MNVIVKVLPWKEVYDLTVTGTENGKGNQSSNFFVTLIEISALHRWN